MGVPVWDCEDMLSMLTTPIIDTMIQQEGNKKTRVVVAMVADSPSRGRELEVVKNED